MEYKPIEYYLNLPWTYTLMTEKYKGKKRCIAYVNECPGVYAGGATAEKAFNSARRALALSLNRHLLLAQVISQIGRGI